MRKRSQNIQYYNLFTPEAIERVFEAAIGNRLSTLGKAEIYFLLKAGASKLYY